MVLKSGGLRVNPLEDDESPRLNDFHASINSIRLRVGVIPLTLSLIKSKPLLIDCEIRNLPHPNPNRRFTSGIRCDLVAKS